LAVPLDSGQKILGVIELVNKHDGSDFTESDATILSLLGIFAGISLEQLERQLEEVDKP
jgi:GAF domain-containing protein